MKNKIAEQRLINAIFTIGKEEYEKEIEVQEGLEEHNLAIEENEEYDEFYEYESYMEDVGFISGIKK